MDASSILSNVERLAARFAKERAARQRRQELVQDDFDQLRESGYLSARLRYLVRRIVAAIALTTGLGDGSPLTPWFVRSKIGPGSQPPG
jgi:hypothetical protein